MSAWDKRYTVVGDAGVDEVTSPDFRDYVVRYRERPSPRAESRVKEAVTLTKRRGRWPSTPSPRRRLRV